MSHASAARTADTINPDDDGYCPVIWPRAIIHLDMNAFFAAIEQHDFPELQGQPVAVTNGMTGTCIITCSYEARAHGVHTGMRLKEARRLCPDIIQRPARPRDYAAVSTTIMTLLRDISPDIEIFSVDEAFMDVTHCQRLHGTPPRIARLAKERVLEATRLPCSVGVSGDKITAKFAAKQQKPDGFTVIPPWQARQRLQDEPVTALCGVADGIGRFLAQHGAETCGDVSRLPVSVLARRFGNLGRRIWLMCHGEDPDPVHTHVAAPKSIGHGKVLPPDTRDYEVLLTYLQHMSEKVAARLRRHNLEAKHFFIGLRRKDGWIGQTLHTATPTQHSKALLKLCRYLLRHHWRGEGIHQVQVTALVPSPRGQQMELFTDSGIPVADDMHDAVMDRVNGHYGEFTLAPARLLQRSNIPNVIAPAWKPDGHRQTIDG